MANVHFHRISNSLICEDYERILNESSFYVLELDRQEAFNLSKYFSNVFAEIRSSNSILVTSLGLDLWLIR